MKYFSFTFALTTLCAASIAFAQEEQSETPPGRAVEDVIEIDPNAPATALAPKVKAREIASGLNNPCGVAVQPGTGTIFVSDSGNHQVVKIVEGKVVPVITDFPEDVYGKGPKVNIGPLGLLFLDEKTLVVGGGGLPDGQEELRVFKLPDNDEPIKAEQQAAGFKLEETDDVKGEGNFYALASNGSKVFVTCNGDDTKGWVSCASIKDGSLENFERCLATKEATEVDAPVGITVSPEGGYLVVGQMGEINVPGDSLITFYDEDLKMSRNIATGLHDICAVAYSPRHQLYVLDYSWAEPTEGGLFQVIADEESDSGIRTKKIIGLDKPTAMAFAPDGSLLITVLGKAEDANSEGKLIRIPVEAEL
ncbi:MAG: hypothetical protein KDB22_13690 [Planctomycetales bacterium]|nr:hypothetical protein [Planctomycetales bacterium]